MEKRARILLVDDEQDFLESCSHLLAADGYELETANGGKPALDMILKSTYDIVLLDLKMPDLDGISVLNKIRESDPTTIVMLITGFPSVDTAVESMKLGAFDYIRKPFSAGELKSRLNDAIKQRATVEENALYKNLAAGISPTDYVVGKSPVVVDLLNTIRKVAASDSSVAIYGEAGTGKTLVARAIHSLSPRSAGVFLSIDCSAVSEAALEKELFGNGTRQGMIEQASGGTLLLDQFASVPSRLQAALASAIETKEFRREGKSVKVACRFIAAANDDPRMLIERKILNPNFFYSINTVEVRVPPLRQRAGDLPLLALHYLSLANTKVNRNIEGFSADVLELFRKYDWPGNLRELRNIIENAVVVTRGPYIQIQDLPASFRDATSGDDTDRLDYKKKKGDSVREYLENLLHKHGGNVKAAAEEAGVHRSTLQRLMKRHGVSAN